MTPSIRSSSLEVVASRGARLSPIAFVAAATSIYAFAAILVRSASFERQPEVLGLALSADLTILMSALFYLLVLRPRAITAVAVVPFFIASLFAARVVLPTAQHVFVAEMTSLLWLAELAVIVYLLISGRRWWVTWRQLRGDDPLDAIGRATEEVMGSGLPSRLMAHELGVLYLSLLSWRRSPHVPAGTQSFSHHRKSSYGLLILAFAFLVPIEAGVVHLLVAKWNPVVAWLITGLSLYSGLWLVAELRSLSLRPTLVGQRQLRLRIGLLYNVRLDWRSIQGLTPFDPDQTTAGTYLDVAPNATPSHLLELSEVVEVHGPLGIRRRADRIGLRVDEPSGFERAIARHLANPEVSTAAPASQSAAEPSAHLGHTRS